MSFTSTRGLIGNLHSTGAGPPARIGDHTMGQPVVHFEVMGDDGDKLRSFYSDLFDWKINADNPMNYGIVDRESNVNADGIGIGGGVGGSPEYPSHVTFYVEVPDVETALAKAESLGGKRMMGPDEVTEGVEIGLFTDPDGLLVGVIKAAS
jgi:predicted enzyme related to lactoylglutathione lyase